MKTAKKREKMLEKMKRENTPLKDELRGLITTWFTGNLSLDDYYKMGKLIYRHDIDFSHNGILGFQKRQ